MSNNLQLSEYRNLVFRLLGMAGFMYNVKFPMRDVRVDQSNYDNQTFTFRGKNYALKDLESRLDPNVDTCIYLTVKKH